MQLRPTASQTVGPYFHIGLPWEGGAERVKDGIRVGGTVYDGEGEVVPDALVEIWQPAERLFGRCATDADGRYAFTTVKPAPVPAAGGGGGEQAPHIAVSLFARGLLVRLVTRIYFPDEEQANAEDAVLAAAGDSLVAAAEDGGYRFDIHLQGELETAFLDV